MRRIYEEKLVEDFIRDYPSEFLGEELSIYLQQATIGGFRPDLIFRDKTGGFIIVEVQLNALDRGHLYRTLEYRDLFMEQKSCDEPRVILFCNNIPQKYERLTKTHRVTCISMTKEDFLAKAYQLQPNLQIEELPNIEEQSRKTIQSVLNELRRNADSTHLDLDLDALVLWFSYWFLNRWDRDENLPMKNLALPEIPETAKLYFNDYNSYRDLDKESEIGKLKVAQLPREIIVGRPELEELEIDHIDMMVSWLDLITHYHVSDFETIELILGYRESNDIYLYEDHIQNRIKKFHRLWRRYGYENRKGYDICKLRSDLDVLGNITFFAGKFPKLEPLHVCERIEIEEGPGTLEHNVNQYREVIRNWVNHGTHGYTSQDLSTVETTLKEDRSKWITVRFYRVIDGVIQSLKEISRMLRNASFDAKTMSVRELIMQIGMMPARRLSNIHADALRLSSRYFFHLRTPMESRS